MRKRGKEAEGKLPARGTRIAYEADAFGREGKGTQSPIVIQEDADVDAAGMWEEGRAPYPGRSRPMPERVTQALRLDACLRSEKSADAIVVGLTYRRRAEPVTDARSIL